MSTNSRHTDDIDGEGMGRPPRGRYRLHGTPRWTWPVAALGALLIFAALAFIAPALAKAEEGGYVSHYNYLGTRFADMTAKICVEDRANVIAAAGKSKYIRYAVEHVNRETAARMVYRYGKGSCAGTGYKYRIIITDNNYDRGYWIAPDRGGLCNETKKTGCFKWGKTVNGHSTYIQQSWAAIRFDTRRDDGSKYPIPGNKRPWVHEFVHLVMGIDDYPTNRYGTPTCNSMAAYCYPGDKTGLHKNDITWFNAIRVQ